MPKRSSPEKASAATAGHDTSKSPVIGIFAIQGAVEEHADCVKKCGGAVKEIRLPADFEGLDGIILPGGESTTMAIVGERWGLFPKLREWVADKKPIWGTCAGMILLSDHAIKQAADGQSLVGGLDVHVCRNFFGSQISSCELDINLNSGTAASKEILSGNTKGGKGEDKKCPAVFIRAPAILSAGPGVEVLASVIAKPHVSSRDDVLRLVGEASKATSSRTSPSKKQKMEYQVAKTVDDTERQEKFEVFVAVQQGNILATSFHPELTDDVRWHQYFLDMIKHG